MLCRCLLMGLFGLVMFQARAETSFPSAFRLANSPGAIGETGHLFLIDEGFFARPFYNDIFGKTDKHLSGATQLGWMAAWERQSLEIKCNWRFLTPSFKENFTRKPLDIPVGRYADWMELSAAYAYVDTETFAFPVQYQLMLGLGHIGNKGAKVVHKKIHQWVGSSLEGLDYTNQPEGRDISRGLETSVLQRLNSSAQQSHLIYSVGSYYNKFMLDLYGKINFIKEFESFSLGLEFKYAQQLASGSYEEPEPFRYEFASGIRLKWFRPSVKYVSNYLKGDKVGQLYFDPLALYFEF